MKQKVIDFLHKFLPYDKAIHFIVGVVIFAIAQLFLEHAALILVFFIAFANECYDVRNSRFDWLDIAWTVGGGLVALIATL